MFVVISAGADVNRKDEITLLDFGAVNLCDIAVKTYLQTTAILMHKGTKVNTRDIERISTLMLATKTGDIDQANRVTTCGKTTHVKCTMKLALDEERCDCVALLAQAGADVNTRSFQGKTALSLALVVGDRECSEVLIK